MGGRRWESSRPGSRQSAARAGGARGVLGQPLQTQPRSTTCVRLRSALARGLCLCAWGHTCGTYLWVCEWLRRVCSGPSSRSRPPASLPEPVLMSLRPGAEPPSPQPLPSERALSVPTAPTSPHLLSQTGRLLAEDGRGPFSLPEETAPRWAAEHRLGEKKSWLTDGFDIFECPPPKTENEVRTRWAWLCRGWRAAGWGGISEGEKNGQPCGPAWSLNPPCWFI